MTTTTPTNMTPEEAQTRALATTPTSTSPVVDVYAALDTASDRLALLGLTVTGMLSLGTAFAPDEARGALALLESIQDDLDTARAAAQGLEPA